MKRIITTFAALALVLTVVAGSKHAAKSSIQEFNVDGVKVILKPATNQVVSAKWFIMGGTANYDLAKEGIEALALAIATDGGTSNYSKSEYHQKLEQYGTSINGSTSFDYANIAMQCVNYKWNESWAIFADVLMNPAFQQKEFGLNMERLVTNVKSSEANPDAKLNDMVMEDVFANHNYMKKPNGSLKSLEKLNLGETKEYYKGIISKSQGFLVVVGNVTKEDVTKKVKATLAKLPQGEYKAPVYKPLNIESSTIKVEDRDIATNYIEGVMNAPDRNSPESMAMRVAFSIFRDRMFEEIRTKRNLSYAPQAYYRRLGTSYSAMYVSTTDPDSALKTMIREVKKVKKEGFKPEELVDKKEQYLTGFYMGQETNSSQASTLAINEMNGGWEKSLSFVDEVYSLKLSDLNKVFKKHAKAIRWYYLGKKTQAPKYIHLEPGRPE